jgi:hypothetical protein
MWQMDLQPANGDKFIAAFCRFLPLGFEPHFFRTISLGGWCLGATWLTLSSMIRHTSQI